MPVRQDNLVRWNGPGAHHDSSNPHSKTEGSLDNGREVRQSRGARKREEAQKEGDGGSNGGRRWIVFKFQMPLEKPPWPDIIGYPDVPVESLVLRSVHGGDTDLLG